MSLDAEFGIWSRFVGFFHGQDGQIESRFWVRNCLAGFLFTLKMNRNQNLKFKRLWAGQKCESGSRCLQRIETPLGKFRSRYDLDMILTKHSFPKILSLNGLLSIELYNQLPSQQIWVHFGSDPNPIKTTEDLFINYNHSWPGSLGKHVSY